MHNIIGTYELTPADRTLLVMPLFHVHGLVCGLLATLLSGGAAVIPQKFSASHFWNDFIEQKCNWYTAGKVFFFSTMAGDSKGKRDLPLFDSHTHSHTCSAYDPSNLIA